MAPADHTEAWRPEAVPGWPRAPRRSAPRARSRPRSSCTSAARRSAPRQWYHPVAPSAVRSPREPTRPRALTDGEVDAIVEGFRRLGGQRRRGRLPGRRAPRRARLPARAVPVADDQPAPRRGGPGGPRRGSSRASRARSARRRPRSSLGIRLSIDGGEEAGFTLDGPVRAAAARRRARRLRQPDRGRPHDLRARHGHARRRRCCGHVGVLRALVDGPLLISQAFRTRRRDRGRARRRRRPRRHGAAADRRSRHAAQAAGGPRGGGPAVRQPATRTAARSTRCCCARSTPTSGRRGDGPRPAAPLVVRAGRGAAAAGAWRSSAPGRRASSARPRWPAAASVVLFDARAAIGGALAVAAAAPNRRGWRALLDFYAARARPRRRRRGAAGRRVGGDDLDGFDEVVARDRQRRGAAGRCPASSARCRVRGDRRGADASARARLLVVDDGFGWWPCASAVELGVRAGFAAITVATPGAAFGATLPPEGRVQLLAPPARRAARGPPVHGARRDRRRRRRAAQHHVGRDREVAADTVIVVGERVARDWSALVPGRRHACA